MIATRALLAVVWLGLAGYLWWFRNEPGAFGPWVAWFALAFAGYNVFRCWSAWAAARQPEAWQRRRHTSATSPGKREFNQDFDFDQDRPTEPKAE